MPYKTLPTHKTHPHQEKSHYCSFFLVSDPNERRVTREKTRTLCCLLPPPSMSYVVCAPSSGKDAKTRGERGKGEREGERPPPLPLSSTF